MNTIDDDCLSCIFEFFSVEELCSLQLISKRFNDCACTAKQRVTELTITESLYWLTKVPERTSLNLNTSTLDEEELILHLNKFPNVKRLYIFGFLRYSFELFNSVFMQALFRDKIEQVYVLFEVGYTWHLAVSKPITTIFPNITHATLVVIQNWRSDEKIFSELQIEQVKTHKRINVMEKHNITENLAYIKDLLAKEPLLRTPLFMKCSATKKAFAREVGTLLTTIGIYTPYDDLVPFEETFFEYWNFIGFNPNEKWHIRYGVPTSNPYTAVLFDDYIVNHLLRAASGYLFASNPTKGCYAAFYNKRVDSFSVEYVKNAIKLLIKKGYNMKESSIKTAEIIDTNARSAALVHSTRISKIEMFSWKDFMISCFEEPTSVEKPPKKKQRVK